MNYDAMGNYYGAVNDMLDTNMEANVKPVTQTITTDPRTGEQMMTVKGRPEDLSANNPNTPTVSQPRFNFGAPQGQPNQYMNLANSASTQPVAYQPPVAPQMAPQPQPVSQPDQTYQRMIQAESRGQNYAPNGQPLTSPAGAMFAAQVLPSTAQNPGYGVRPAQSQTAEEYNRVGQDYYNAMLQKFGNPQAAAAAYNAGPGRVQQNLAANAGQLNVAQLPRETQQYLQRVQPGTAPAVQTQPMIAGAPSSDVGATPTEQALRQQQTPDQRYANDFIRVQNNPAELAKLRYDPNAPEWVRTIASQKELQDLKNRDETQKVQQKIQTAIENNDGRTIANLMNPRKKDTDEGSIAKAFLFSLIGFQSGAQAEVEKMGLKDKWDIARLGDADVTVKYNPRGEAKEAIYTSGPMAGQRVTADELPMLSGQGGAAGKTKADVSTQDVERNGVAGRVVTENRNGRTMTYVESGGQRFAYDTTWQPRSIATSAAKADYGLITDLRKKFGTDAISAMTEYQKYKGPLDERSRSEFLNLYGFNAAAPTGQTPPPAQLPPVTVPGAVPTAPAVPGAVDQSQQNMKPGAGTNMRTTPGPVVPTPITVPVGVPTGVTPTQGTLTTPIATLEAAGKAEAANVAKDVNKSYNAKQIYNIIEPVNAAIQNATGSGLGAKIDDIAAFFGKSTEGAQGAAKLNVLADTLVKTVPRFEGPQSDRDTASYQAAAGQLNDRTVPTKTRLAALQTIIDINKKYAPELDWTFGAAKAAEAGAAGAPKSGTTKTINGITYEYDGRGWKKSTGI
jgi:hypothetical protein